MNLTELQKNIVQSIIEGNVFNMQTFTSFFLFSNPELEEIAPTICQSLKESFAVDLKRNTTSFDSLLTLPISENEALERTNDFLVLWSYLEKKDLVTTIPCNLTFAPKSIATLSKSIEELAQNKPQGAFKNISKRLSGLISERKNKELVPFNSGLQTLVSEPKETIPDSPKRDILLKSANDKFKQANKLKEAARKSKEDYVIYCANNQFL